MTSVSRDATVMICSVPDNEYHPAQTMLEGVPGYHHASTEVYKTVWQH
jgi:hypothetical protein